MKGPINTDIQIITQPFKGDAHRGVDLRSIDLKTWRKIGVIITEPCRFTRGGQDGFGNDFAVFLTADEIELKYIHVTFNRVFSTNMIMTANQIIGVTQIYGEINRGNSKAHHLHFETWKDGKPFDSVEYFHDRGIQYDFR